MNISIRHGTMADAQAICRAESLGKAQRAFQKFQVHWRESYPAMVRRLENDLSGLLKFLPPPPTSVVEAAHYPRHRALLREGSAPHPTHGLLCQCSERGSNRVLDL